MIFTYDDEADALYVYVNGRPGQRRAVALTDVLDSGVTVDLAADGKLFGIEVLSASTRVDFGGVVDRFGLDEPWRDRLRAIESMRFTPARDRATQA